MQMAVSESKTLRRKIPAQRFNCFGNQLLGNSDFSDPIDESKEEAS